MVASRAGSCSWACAGPQTAGGTAGDVTQLLCGNASRPKKVEPTAGAHCQARQPRLSLTCVWHIPSSNETCVKGAQAVHRKPARPLLPARFVLFGDPSRGCREVVQQPVPAPLLFF